MANHRSDRAPTPLHRLADWWRSRRQLPVDQRHTQSDQGWIFVSEPITLAIDHLWRNVPCVVCWTLPAYTPVRVISFALPAVGHMHTWSIETATVLMCDRHPVPDTNQIQWLLHHREDPWCDQHNLPDFRVPDFVPTPVAGGIW